MLPTLEVSPGDKNSITHLISGVLDVSSNTLLNGLDTVTGTVCEKLKIKSNP